MKHIIGVKPEAPAGPAATSAAPAAQWLTVNDDEADQRLDNYLMRQLKGAQDPYLPDHPQRRGAGK